MNGGSYGHNGGRQQRKRPRDFDDDQYRRPRTVDTLDKLKRDLINLCDPGNIGPTEDIRYVARKLAIDFETPENQDRILDLFRDSVLQLSVKTCQYAAVFSLAGAQNAVFGNACVARISTTLSQALEVQNWRDVKLLLRFLACIDRCLLPTTLTTLSLLQALLVCLQNAQLAGPTVTADRISEIILITLPYLIATASPTNTTAKQGANDLVEGMQSYIALRALKLSESQLTTDVLHSLYQKCVHASGLEWHSNYLPQLLDFFGADGATEVFELAAVNIPPISREQDRLLPRSNTSLFHSQAVQSVPTDSDLASSVFQDLVRDILDLLVANRKDAARFLIDLESYVQPGIFVLRGTPLDKIPDAGPTWKAEDVVVQGIFSELFALPQPRHRPVYYHSVLTELCKLVPQAVAPTFGRAIRSIYNNLEHMEPELAYRAWDWFSHHLSNFGFNWKWQEWIPDLTLSALHPKSAFIREAIMKEAELSYNQRIKTTLPAEYHHLLPDEAPGPNFIHNKSEDPLFSETSALLQTLSGQSTKEEITAALLALEQKVTELELPKRDHETTTILIQAVLQIGHQSFSHALNTIEQHLELLQTRCDDSPSSRQSTVSAVLQFWSGRPFIASTLLQKLLNYRIISPISVLQEVLPNGDVSSSVLWELLDTTLDKVAKRVVQVQDRLARMNAEQGARTNGEAEGVDGGKSEELMRLERTWVDVQAEQKDVLTFTLRHLLSRLDNVQNAPEWTEYWIKGLLSSVLRKHEKHILALDDDVLQAARLESLSGIKFK